MKKIILFLLIGMIIQNGINAQKNGDDDIYRELCLFLVHRKIISEERIMSEFKGDYSSLIAISDIFEAYHPQKKADLSKEFGIYKFGFLYIEHHSPYILIKNNDSYKIFLRRQTEVIIQEILKIREESPNLIDEVLFNKYLKEIINYNIGADIMFKFGKIMFIENLPELQ